MISTGSGLLIKGGFAASEGNRAALGLECLLMALVGFEERVWNRDRKGKTCIDPSTADTELRAECLLGKPCLVPDHTLTPLMEKKTSLTLLKIMLVLLVRTVQQPPHTLKGQGSPVRVT